MRLPLVLLLIVLINLPFGYWRAALRKLSPTWFVAVHAPVPLVVAVRLAIGVGWSLTTFPLFLLAYFTGQYLGARLRQRDDVAPILPDDGIADRRSLTRSLPAAAGDGGDEA